MAAPRPPSAAPPPDTLDIDETAPPQMSPLRGALPFGPQGVVTPQSYPPAPRPPAPPPSPFGEETAPPARSPLAAALPFRHGRPAAATAAIPIPTPEDLARLGRGGAGPSAPADPKAAERSRLEQARTVAFAMPPVPANSGLSIEQYAALCAEIAVLPEAADAAFAKYGLGSSKDRLAADVAWQGRLRADAALMERWKSLYLHYHEHYHRSAKR